MKYVYKLKFTYFWISIGVQPPVQHYTIVHTIFICEILEKLDKFIDKRALGLSEQLF